MVMDMTSAPADNHKPHAMRVGQVTAIRVLVWGAIGLLLYVAHVAFIPIALALLVALVLSGPVEALHRIRVPRAIGAALILVMLLASVAGAVDLMWNPAQQWFAAAPQTMKVIKRKLSPATKFITHVEDLRNSAGSLAATGHAGSAAAPAATEPESGPAFFLDTTRELVVSALTFLIVTLFLLAGGPPMLARMTAAFIDDLNAGHVLAIIENVRGEVGRFYVTTALINLGLGFATAGAMMACGMPTPFLWGAMAATLNFIPYAGAVTTLTVITLVAFVTFDSIGHVAAASFSYVVLAGIEGQIVQPLLVGRRLDVNPLLIFLALWFGGLFWGLAGVIMATPALVALKVVAEHAISGKALLEFLGPNDPSLDGKMRLAKLVRYRRAAKAA
jgi:predicted PurR-regulated permease PerM